MVHRLSEKEAERLYEKYQTPAHVIAHCREVTRVACGIAEQLNKHGYHLDLDLIRGAGLAHDVARTSEEHWNVGAEILRELGYDDEANIVQQHMSYQFKPVDRLTETDMVCFGDRLVKEHDYVGVDERFRYIMDKAPKRPGIREHLIERREEMRSLLNQIENIIGVSMDALFKQEKVIMNYTEKLNQLLKRVEKPGRYIGGEINSVKKNPEDVDARFAFCFPDLYEIGMSYLGMQILYKVLNDREKIYCERVFAPAVDMEALMREENMPLMTLESKTPLKEMDFVGFTLQYEMSYTTVLNMIDLAQIPLKAADRASEASVTGKEYPLIVAGGPCALNPEPLAEFIDMFLIGDGEEVLPAVVELYADCKKKGMTRQEFYHEACKLDGVYIPSLYDVVYNEDGTIKELCKLYNDAPMPVRRAIIGNIENLPFPTDPIVPFVEAVHDRSVVETFRGCTRGCRFCQAGMIYRPVRERSKEKIMQLAMDNLHNTGNDELSLLSLSTSDYSQFEDLCNELIPACKKENVSLSLPSLRIDKFAFDVLNKIQEYRKSGLTYAPEAGTQRLRDVINKGVTEADIYKSIEQALELGWSNIKLYFMIGLPTETDEDLDGIAEIARKIVELNYKLNGRKGGRFNVTVSVSNFVPKANTPFQWESQNTAEEFARKHNYLTTKLHTKHVTFNYHDNATSSFEAVFARGDRRCSKLLLAAFRNGCKFDSWTEHFKPEGWEKAFADSGIDRAFYTERKREFDEVLPWDIIDSGVSKKFLKLEAVRAYNETTTHDCRHGCVGCGINRYVKCEMEGTL